VLLFLVILKQITMKKFLLFILLVTTTFIANAQINKNNWMVGGSFAFSSSEVMDITTKTTLFSPNLGYFFLDKFAGGVKGNLSALKMEDEDVMSTAMFGPYVRYYLLKNDSEFNLHLEGNYMFGSTKAAGESFNQDGYELAVTPMVFLNKHTALEMRVSYGSVNTEGDTERMNSFGLGIGFQIHLGGGASKK
jgi:hypothetical protein